MKIRVEKYEPPKEVTYTTTEAFLAIDKETEIGLRVTGSTAEWVGLNPQTYQYDQKGYDMQTYRGTNIEVIRGLLAAYESRDL